MSFAGCATLSAMVRKNKQLNRRRFLTAVGGSVLGLGLNACSQDPPTGRYTAADIALMAAQRELEKKNSGQGQFGQQRYSGYRGLAELPWFELDKAGALQCIDPSIPMVTDVHCHLGRSVLFKPDLDLSAQTKRVSHLLDCDAEIPGCALDLDIYINGNFTDDGLFALKKGIVAQAFWGGGVAPTQSIPNLLREMDSMRVERSLILPIKLGLPFGDDQTETWRTAINQYGAADRLLAGLSIHPRDDARLDQMRGHAKSGTKIMKLHPTMQRFYPDDPSMMEVYALAEELGIVIFFHGGRAGIEPESMHRYAMPRHYAGAIASFPKVQFILGHAGARDNEAMLDLAIKHDNAWLGIAGQGVTQLDKMIAKTGGERLLFGTDWPFYHIGSSLAKVLIVTDAPGRRKIRSAILRDNAKILFG